MQKIFKAKLQEEEERKDAVKELRQNGSNKSPRLNDKKKGTISSIASAKQSAYQERDVHQIAYEFLNEQDSLKLMIQRNQQQKLVIKNLIINKNYKNFDFISISNNSRKSLYSNNSKGSKSNGDITGPELFLPKKRDFPKKLQEQYEQKALNLLNNNVKDLADIISFIFFKEDYFKYIQMDKFNGFLQNLIYHYNKRKNPFHNFRHGTMVMHGCWIYSQAPALSDLLSKQTLFALVFAGLCHDVNHTARSNQFEINSHSKLAVRYNDNSPLENHHIATLFKMIKVQENNIFETLDAQEFIAIRKKIVYNILFTDVKKHFDLMGEFEKKFLQGEVNDKTKIQNLKEIDEGQTNLLTATILHTADFHGNAQEFAISCQWSRLVSREFTAQFEEEQDLGIPVTPYYEGLNDDKILARAESGFISFIVLPLFKSLNIFLDNYLEYFVNNLQQNKIEWANIQSRTEI